jgi:CheY-like chemotaxis protein
MQEPVVLCLEDDEDLLRLLQQALSRNEYTVLRAGTGGEGLRLAATGGVHAAILDYELPDMTGGEVARQVRQMCPKIPILTFSAACNIPLSDLGNIDALVVKSEGVRALVRILQKLMDRFPVKPFTARPGEFRCHLVQ